MENSVSERFYGRKEEFRRDDHRGEYLDGKYDKQKTSAYDFIPKGFESYVHIIQAANDYNDFVTLLNEEVSENVLIYLHIKGAQNTSENVNMRYEDYLRSKEPKK